MSTSSDPWRRAAEKAAARLKPKNDYADDDINAAGYALVKAINAKRAHGAIPDVTSSFASARARANWRERDEALTDALAEAAAQYAVTYGADGDAVLTQVQGALAADEDATLYIPEDEPETPEPADDPDRPATLADLDAYYDDAAESDEAL